MSAAAAQLLDAILPAVRSNLPAGVSASYFDGFVRRNRVGLERVIASAFPHLAGRHDGSDLAELPELWSAAKRTTANVTAMVIAAALQTERRKPTAEERRALAAYSGWGGLSIEGAASRFPEGFPVPEARGLIHEYYTPTKVARAVAELVRPLLPALEDADGVVRALEPSAGIGRFVNALSGPGFERVQWTACEWSELSSRMLRALRPDVTLHVGPFERWVRDAAKAVDAGAGLSLVVSNPPYGARGASIAEDPDRAYREKMAYHYFLRRALDLLRAGGVGIFLIPSGFLSGRTAQFVELRRKVLLRHHLAAAWRLPSMGEDGRENLFPGAMLVTDLLVFRSRGGQLDDPDPRDVGVIDGRYFEEAPDHVLGRVVGQDAGEDDQTKKPRYGFQVVGQFNGLPPLIEREICAACKVVSLASARGAAAKAGRVGVTRAEGAADTTNLTRDLAGAVLVGARVDQYLKIVAAEQDDSAHQLWPELHEALLAWHKANGNPHANVELRKLAQAGNAGAERFLSAFDRAGQLIDGLRRAPPRFEPRFTGLAEDVVGQAEHLYRAARSLTVPALLEYHRGLGGRLSLMAALQRLFDAGWCIDNQHLLPRDVYLTGDLWPRTDRAQELSARPPAPEHGAGGELLAKQGRRQVQMLLAAIQPAVFDDIEGVSPRQGWLPLELVSGWFNATYTQRGGYAEVELERKSGFVQPKGWDYAEIDKKSSRGDLHPELLLVMGWINHDKTLFSPSKKGDEDNEKDIDKIRVKKAAEWDASFKGWVSADLGRRIQVEHAYNRQMRGFVPPSYGSEPLQIARWTRGAIRLKPHQVAAARRILANRGGLLAFDVGVGKTYTGIGVMARARQEGWARRPVILVPNSIVWKWYADIQRVLPDYRVAVIGSKHKTVIRGERKGQATSDTDTPQERGEKWSRFQAGEYDCVLLTYTALGRTRMNEQAVRDYANHVESIQREVKLRQRNAAKRKKLSEREQAIVKEGVSAWVAQQMELAEGWEYDPGIAWDDIGVDLLIVDEAQNYKNLYLPEDREGGVPRFMGNAGEGSKRAWQLDFRCAAVRRKTGGSGVVLLSATPAKNSPLEFYNLIQYVDPRAWTSMGIRDPEQFIDRYLKIEMKSVMTPSMEVEERGAVIGFQNLHELRDVIFRYGEFKTAEDVGLKLPEPKVEMVEVDMDSAQDAKYDRYVREIEAALKSDDPGEKAQILGLLARMALVSIHAQLDEGFKWKTADQVSSPSSPKFAAMTERVLRNPNCGHIVFVDNVAAHRWVMETLVKAGIARGRIGVLNAEVAPNAADRQRIALEFNGDPENEVKPKYDVVIANAIAYEGIDLQTRTCAIHHLDLPWEPATLQQRNGRGVRQGNSEETIAIYYYFARRSQDALRFNLIQGKRGWMTQLIKSQDRDTNNPGAQMDMGPEEILLLISRNPDQTRARLEAVRAQREAEAKKRMTLEASKLARAINARYRNAERTRDSAEAARLRAEADERFRQLSRVYGDHWPWVQHARVVRERPIMVPDGGPPLYDGLVVAVPDPWNAAVLRHLQFGEVVGSQIAVNSVGSPVWTLTDAKDALAFKPEHFDAVVPEAGHADTIRAIRAMCDQRLRYSGDWRGFGWDHAPDSWVERTWPQVAGDVLGALSAVSYYNAQAQRIPVMSPSGLRVERASAIYARPATAGWNAKPEPVPGMSVVAPTDAGWRAFLAAAPTSGLKFGELEEAAQWWWARHIPRNLLSSSQEAANVA